MKLTGKLICFVLIVFIAFGGVNLVAAAEELLFDVSDYGAVGDGLTDDGEAIQKALDACNEAGGGTVYFSLGTYGISRTVFYYSNQNLLFENGAVIKRIANGDLSEETAGVLLCNWFEIADTQEHKSAVACRNVSIVGGIFDGGGALPENEPIAVAMINTCHAENVTVKDCTFINNYNAHCIEINSTDNAEIVNCVFSDYVGTADAARYNEMIQIDKAVNAALGSYLSGNNYRTVKGYFKETRIDEFSPDCRGSNNITIRGCVFFGNENCSAIGNHHISDYKTTNNFISVFENEFSGGSGDRGYITFDGHTVNMEIYSNVFSDGAAGVTVSANEPNCNLYDNTFIGCKTAYTGNVNAYDNSFVDTPAPNIEEEVSPISSFFKMIADFFAAFFELLKNLFKIV